MKKAAAARAKNKIYRRAVVRIMWMMVMWMVAGVQQAIAGPGCAGGDLATVTRELTPCLHQFYLPPSFAIAQQSSCCCNSTCPCCYALRAALPVGDDCMCDFMRAALSQTQGKPYSLDAASALLQISAQCSVDFGLSSDGKLQCVN